MNLPYCQEAEEQVVGAVLVDGAALDEISGMIEAGDFYSPACRAVFQAALDLDAKGEAVNLLFVADKLKAVGKLAGVGGPAALSGLAGLSATSATITHYAGMVREYATRRAIMTEAARILQESETPPDDLSGWLDDIARRLSRITDGGVKADFRAVSDLAAAVLADAEALVDGKTGDAIASGLSALDKRTGGGFKPGELVIIAGRPGAGKSALAASIALAAAKAGHAVGLISLEMSRAEIMKRLLCQEAQVPLDALRPGGLQDGDWTRILDATEDLRALPIVIDDSPALSAWQARARARRIARERGLDVLVVDYLQLLSGERKRGDNREREIADISRSLKLIARELKIPVLALSQLNRAPEAREEGRIRLADLRESGAIEQDADVVLSLYRPGLYSPANFEAGYSRLEILKQRNGPSSIFIELGFNGRLFSFSPWTGNSGGKRKT
jgi:replicative DNA helicase